MNVVQQITKEVSFRIELIINHLYGIRKRNRMNENTKQRNIVDKDNEK